MKRNRRKIDIEVVESVDSFGYITDKELLEESEMYEPDRYNPLESMEEKEVVIPNTNKTETITMRFTKDEYDAITTKASEKRVSKSSYIRMLLFNKPQNQNEIDIGAILSEIQELKDNMHHTKIIINNRRLQRSKKNIRGNKYKTVLMKRNLIKK